MHSIPFHSKHTLHFYHHLFHLPSQYLSSSQSITRSVFHLTSIATIIPVYSSLHPLFSSLSHALISFLSKPVIYPHSLPLTSLLFHTSFLSFTLVTLNSFISSSSTCSFHSIPTHISSLHSLHTPISFNPHPFLPTTLPSSPLTLPSSLTLTPLLARPPHTLRLQSLPPTAPTHASNLVSCRTQKFYTIGMLKTISTFIFFSSFDFSIT